MYLKTILRDRKNHKILNYVVDTPKKKKGKTMRKACVKTEQYIDKYENYIFFILEYMITYCGIHVLKNRVH